MCMGMRERGEREREGGREGGRERGGETERESAGITTIAKSLGQP